MLCHPCSRCAAALKAAAEMQAELDSRAARLREQQAAHEQLQVRVMEGCDRCSWRGMARPPWYSCGLWYTNAFFHPVCCNRRVRPTTCRSAARSCRMTTFTLPPCWHSATTSCRVRGGVRAMPGKPAWLLMHLHLDHRVVHLCPFMCVTAHRCNHKTGLRPSSFVGRDGADD